MSITAYGKYYSWEDSLFWPGSQNDENIYARILGHELPNKAYKDPRSPAEADFSSTPGVYLLHDQSGEVVYVGQALKLVARLNAHCGDHLRNRWTHYSWFATGKAENPEETKAVVSSEVEDNNANDIAKSLSLNMLEAVLRTAFEPRLNLQGGRWEETPLYAQTVKYEFVYLREVYEEIRANKKKIR